MTDHKEFDRLVPVLVETNHVALADMLLRPLKLGQLVVLRINDPRLPKKRRIAGAPRLFLLPMLEGLLIALEGYGAEVVNPANLKSISFVRLGINATLSDALCETVRSIFNEGETHGT